MTHAKAASLSGDLIIRKGAAAPVSLDPGLASKDRIAHPRKPEATAPKGGGLLLPVLGFALGALLVLAWTVHGRDLQLLYQDVEGAIFAESGSSPQVPGQEDRIGSAQLGEPDRRFEEVGVGAAPPAEAIALPLDGKFLGSEEASTLASVDPPEPGEEAAFLSANAAAQEAEIAVEPGSIETLDLDEGQEPMLEVTSMDETEEIAPRVRAAVIGTDGAAVIAGIAPPGSAWIISHNDNPIGIVTANASGTWKHFPEAPLLGRDHRFELLPATDQDGFAEPSL